MGLYRLLYQYFLSVQLIYEDRYRLWSFSCAEGQLVEKTLPLKRSAELSQLSGLRRTYVFSTLFPSLLDSSLSSRDERPERMQ